MELSKKRAILDLVATQAGLDESFRREIKNMIGEYDYMDNMQSRSRAERKHASRNNSPAQNRSAMKHTRQKH
jgi:hypothetical protein